MPTGRAALVLTIALAALLCACPSTSKKPDSSNAGSNGTASPDTDTEPDDGTEAVVVYENDDLRIYAPDTGSFFEDLEIFLGGERSPSIALRKIVATHDLSSWTYRPEVPDAVEITRDAVEELRDSDYDSWEETSLIVQVVSMMAVRDPASVVRTDCLSTLDWFRTRVREEVIRLDPPLETTEQDVTSAFEALDAAKGDRRAAADPKKAKILLHAVGVLGSHRWDEVDSDRPAHWRSSLSGPRHVVRRLGRRDVTAHRANPEIAGAVDAALIRVTDQIIIMTMIGALADRTAYVRAAAAKTLAEARDPRAVSPIILSIDTEPRDFVIQDLVRALGRCALGEKRREAVPALAGLLVHTDVTVRQAAAREMERLTGAGLDVDPAAWLRWWKDNAKDYGQR
ncbi:MAG: hypothetical protein ABFS86_07055 [Planctomycetota bacterium]